MSDRRAWPIAVPVWLIGLTLSVVALINTRFTADMSAFLPKAPTAEQRVLVDELSHGALSRLMLIGIEGSDAPTRARISSALADALRRDGAFASVHNGDPLESARDQAYVFANRYLLSPTVTPERFTVAGLAHAIGDSIDALASPAGMLLKSALPRDPTGETAALAAMFDASARPRVVEGAWASRDGRRALLIAETRAAGSEIDAQSRAVDAVRAAFGRAVAAAGTGAGQVTLLLSGTGVFAVASRATIQHEVAVLSAVGTMLVVVLLLAIYRSPIALALGLVPVVSGALAAIVVVGLAFGEVHGLTLGFGTTLIGEAIDYAIYLFVQSADGRAARDRDAQGETRDARNAAWIASFWPTIRLGVLTSICGFATLLLSGFPGLAQLGLYSIVGLVVAAVVTRFVLPHLEPRGFAIRDLAPLGARVASAVDALRRVRWIAPAIAVASIAVLVAHRDALWNTELSALSPVSATDQALDQTLRDDLGAPDARYLVVAPGPTVQAALEASERVTKALQPLVDGHLLAGFEAPSRFLPSAATQAARQAALPARAELAARVREAVKDLPLRAERLTPFLDDVEAARKRPPLRREDLAGTSLGQAIDALVIRRDEGFAAVVPLRVAPGATLDPQPIRSALALRAPDALFIDMKAEADRLYAGYLHEALVLSAAGFVAIVVLLAVALRDARRVAAVVGPLVVAVLAVAAALVSARPMILLHLVGMLLIVAVGSNYALFFDRGIGFATRTAGSGLTDLRMLASLLAANLATVMAFGVLAFSSVPVLSALGATVAPGAMLALAFAAMLARGTRRAATLPQ